MFNARPYERRETLTILPPVAATAARTSSYVLPKNYQRAEVRVLVGAATGTGQLTLLKAADTSGGSSQSIATFAYGSTNTQDNRVYNVSIDPGDMCDEVRPYFAITLGSGVALASAVIDGFDPRFAPRTPVATVEVDLR